MKKYNEKFSTKINEFFEKESIFTKYCIKIFERHINVKNEEAKQKLLTFWKAFLDVPKMHKSIGISQRKSSLEKESALYILVNEEAFTLLNNIKASDEKCDEFNRKKNITRIMNRVLNREYSLCDPLQRSYDVIIDSVSSRDLLKMSKISEDQEEYEEDKSESYVDIDESYDKLDDLDSLGVKPEVEGVNKSTEEQFAPYEKVLNEKSAELPERRSFFQLFANESLVKPKSDNNESSFAEKKTRNTGTSPSSFSSPVNTSTLENNVSNSKYVV